MAFKLIELLVVVTTVVVAPLLTVQAMGTAACAAEQADPWSGNKTVWNGYDRYDFEVDGLTYHIVVPR